MLCPVTAECAEIGCADGDGCIQEEDFCDGKEDCNDGSDEATCDGLFELCINLCLTYCINYTKF